jgi:hypothetical protein
MNIIKTLQDLYDNTHSNGCSRPDVMIAMKDIADFLQHDLGQVIEELHEQNDIAEGLEAENQLLRRMLIENGVEYQEEVLKEERQLQFRYEHDKAIERGEVA